MIIISTRNTLSSATTHQLELAPFSIPVQKGYKQLEQNSIFYAFKHVKFKSVVKGRKNKNIFGNRTPIRLIN